jgi:hypothetical protein
MGSIFDNDDFFKGGFGSSFKTSSSNFGGMSGGTSMSTSTVTKKMYNYAKIEMGKQWWRRRQ